MLPKGLGNLANLGGMLQKAMEMKKKVEEITEALAAERIEANAGGGMVSIVMTGDFRLDSLKIDPSLVEEGDMEMVETLVAAAVNEGARKVHEMIKAKRAEVMGELDIPGLT